MRTRLFLINTLAIIIAPTMLWVDSDCARLACGESLNGEWAASIVCGDADRSGILDIGDAVFTLNYVFAQGPAPDPPSAGDQNCDGAINIADCVYLIAYLYLPGSEAPCCFTDADYCPRKHTSGFDLVTALQMARLANEAYEVGSDLDSGDVITDCWVAIDFLQSDQNVSCDVIDVPGREDVQLFVARDPWTGDLVVSFRGTGTLPDWVTDAQALNPVDWTFDDGTVVENGVHRGFYCAYYSVKDQLKSLLESNIPDLTDFPDARVYFTGHSLGGALTTLAALDLSDWLIDTYGYDKFNVIVFSVGSARPFKQNLYLEFIDRVPNHYLIMEKTDLVPYLMPTYSHVQRVAVINSREDASGNVLQTRLDFGNGAEMLECGPINHLVPWSYDGVAGHDRETYITRLQKVVTPGVPTVSLDVNQGYMYLLWGGNIKGPCDMVTLCKNCPDYFSQFDFITGDWAYVVNGSGHQTLRAKSEGYQAAYVNSFGKVLAKSAPYVAKRPSKLTITRIFLTSVEVQWQVADEGLYDYVAIYDEKPSSAGPNGYLFGTKHLVNTDLNDKWKFDLPFGKFWVAYVTADQLVGGNRRILRTAGPID